MSKAWKAQCPSERRTPLSCLRSALAAVLLLAACAAPAPQPGASNAGPVTVKLIAFNDFHGHLQPPGSTTRVPVEGGAEIEIPTGGVAWLSGQIKVLQAQNPRSAVVAAGDLIGASPLISSLLDHEPTMAALTDAGLEFSAVGNHEFDRGVPELLRLQKLAGFQYLAANVRYQDTGKLLFPAWASKQLQLPGGRTMRVAFVGAVLRDTPSIVTGNAVAGLEFSDEADSVNAVVREIRAAGIEAIVMLVHEGGFTDQVRFDDLTCPGFRGPILGIVDRLDPAIDVVISAHTHRPYICRRNGRLVTSAGQEGRMVTDIDLTVDAASGDVVATQARQVAVVNNTRPDPQPAAFPVSAVDAGLQQRVAGWVATIAPLANRAVGTFNGELTRRPNAAGETTLGDVIADAQLASTNSPASGGAQLAITNNGGLRADLSSPDGIATHAHTFAVHPFGNHVVTVTLTGSEIDAALEKQWQGAGSLLQVSANFSYRWSASAAPGGRVAPGDILLDGRPITPDGFYRVTLSDFLADGGDGYTIFRQGRDRTVGPSDVEALESYLLARSPLAPPTAARITKLP
jgi:5'-nucleotidase